MTRHACSTRVYNDYMTTTQHHTFRHLLPQIADAIMQVQPTFEKIQVTNSYSNMICTRWIVDAPNGFTDADSLGLLHCNNIIAASRKKAAAYFEQEKIDLISALHEVPRCSDWPESELLSAILDQVDPDQLVVRDWR